MLEVKMVGKKERGQQYGQGTLTGLGSAMFTVKTKGRASWRTITAQPSTWMKHVMMIRKICLSMRIRENVLVMHLPTTAIIPGTFV